MSATNGAEQYSVNFMDGGVADTMACDWRWPDGKAVWMMSSRDNGECRWHFEGWLNEDGRRALLEHFGLQSVSDQLLLEVITYKSPSNLLKLRRELEGRNADLEKLNPISDRAGGHIPAEMAA